MKNESVCETCSGTGWVTIKRDNAEFARRCDCRTNDILLTKAEKANIPKKFFPCRLDDYYPDAGFSSQKKAKKNVKT
ncbi:MAG: hypothetical protein GY950_31080, partial [bacterium]|nr:hypothetical protein [bacterium]